MDKARCKLNSSPVDELGGGGGGGGEFLKGW